MITKEQVDEAWKGYHNFRDIEFGGPGNGCDDYRDCSPEVSAEMMKLYKTARDLQKQYDESHHYVENDVFKFRISLKREFEDEDITIYTKPFPDFPIGEYKSEEQVQEFYDKQEDLVQARYFTKEKIEELKKEFIKRIQECENPFYICCVDKDGGYNVTKDQLFDID